MEMETIEINGININDIIRTIGTTLNYKVFSILEDGIWIIRLDNKGNPINNTAELLYDNNYDKWEKVIK